MNSILIGYVYNKNGMTTWCIEAARALQSIGHNVLVATSSHGAKFLPSDVTYMVVEDKRKANRTILQKIVLRIKKYSWHIFFPDVLGPLSNQILQEACKNGFVAEIILWNQTNLLSEKIKAPQWVVGWAYPARLAGYLNKLFIPGSGNKVNRFLELWYWYRIDNMAYRRATGVLTVTKALTEALGPVVKNIVHAAPSCSVGFPMTHHKTGPVSLCISALWLENKRKNIGWMVDALAAHPDCKNCTIHFMGEASDAFRAGTKAVLSNAIFHGYLPREKAIEVLSAADIMLFGSLQDDWGYVQIEAMSSGMVVVAPDQIPCCEIIPDKNCLYAPGDQADFSVKISKMINNPEAVREQGKTFYRHWQKNFSSKPFGMALQQAIEKSFRDN